MLLIGLLGFVDALQETGEVPAVLSFILARNGCWVLSSAFFFFAFIHIINMVNIFLVY